MGDHLQITFRNIQPAQSELLIAQLADHYYEGFEEEENILKAFIQQEKFDRSLLDELSARYTLSFDQEIIREQNWNEVWESNFHPVIVDDFVAIRADFHQPVKNVEYEIVITPKMSFGTGHHATTYMMIELMEDVDFKNKTVLDFGTGTGILAILAELSGAEKIYAIDNDDWSIENAKENFQKNNCRRISLQKALDASSDKKFDIILANINKNVILENFEVLKNELESDGMLLLSGLLEKDRDDIITKAKELKLNEKTSLARNNWIAIQLSK